MTPDAGTSALRRVVAQQLAAAGCVAATEEADELFAAAPDEDTVLRWARRRQDGEPLAWITGSVGFCGRRVIVDHGVYVPRPQSEQLARRAVELLAPVGGRAADLCTGTGAIAAHLQAEVPRATVVGVDIDVRAVTCARHNGVVAVVGGLAEPLRHDAFDVVTAVAPYVPTAELSLLAADVRDHEPRRALDGGADGLDLVRSIVVDAARVLRPNGWLLVELGGDQDEALRPTLEAAGFSPAHAWFDAEGDLRGLAAQAAGGRRPR